MRWELPLDGDVVVLTEPNGERTDEGDAYRRIGRRLGVANFELIAWRPGMHMQPGTLNEVAFTVDGHLRVVRRFNPQSGRYVATAPWGVDYFRDHATEFTVELPVYRVVMKLHDGVPTYLRALHGDNCWLPITDQEMIDYMTSHGQLEDHHALGPAQAAGGIGAAGVVPAIGTPEAQRAWIRETLMRYIATMPLLDGHRVIAPFTQSSIYYAYDPTREPTFDEEVSHVRHAGPMTVQLVLNRPLRGIVVVPDEMYGKTGIFPVSWEETQDGENCVLNGLALGITKRKDKDTRVRNRKWVDGKKVTVKPEIIVGEYDSDAEPNEEEEPSSSTGGQKMINVAKYTMDEMKAKVDQYFNRRYPLQEQDEGPP